MREHHRVSIEKLATELRNDPRYVALIIGGSIAKGREREDSDVDITLVASEEEFERCKLAKDFHYFRTDLTDYAGGYVDGTVCDVAFLHRIAEDGNEATRAAFTGSWIEFSRVDGLDELINTIPVYPIEQQREKIESFWAHFEAARWFFHESVRREDTYLRTWATSELALYGGRMILAHNRILYPYHKWFRTELKGAGNKPADFMRRFDNLINEPSVASADAFYDSITGFRSWETAPEGWASRFRQESEWHWLAGRAPLRDR